MSIRFTINGFINSNDDIGIGNDYIILPTGKEIKIMPMFMFDKDEYTRQLGKLSINYDIKIEESEYHGEGWDS